MEQTIDEDDADSDDDGFALDLPIDPSGQSTAMMATGEGDFEDEDEHGFTPIRDTPNRTCTARASASASAAAGAAPPPQPDFAPGTRQRRAPKKAVPPAPCAPQCAGGCKNISRVGSNAYIYRRTCKDCGYVETERKDVPLVDPQLCHIRR